MKRIVKIGLSCLLVLCLAGFAGKQWAASSRRAISAEAIEQASAYVTQDTEGNYLGPTNFAFEANEVTFLNTARNTVYTFRYDRLRNDVVLQSKVNCTDFGIYVFQLDRYNGETYLLGNTFTVYQIDKNGIPQELYNLSDALGDALHLYYGPDLATVSSFIISNDQICIYPCYLDENSGGAQTCFLPLNASALSADSMRFVDGSLADDGTLYTTALIPENNLNCGHSAVVTLKDADGTVLHEIHLKSEQYITDAKYLGTDANGNYIVKEYTCAASGDEMEAVLYTIDKNDRQLGSAAALDDDNSANAIRILDGAIYDLEAGNEGIPLREITMAAS